MKFLKLLCFGIALLLSISIGYSKLQQQLTVSGTSNITAQSGNQYTYTYSLYPWPSYYHYYDYDQLYLTYTGTNTSVTSWVMTITTPSDAVMIDEWCIGCEYTYSAGTLKVYSTVDTGSISPGGTVPFEICFQSAVTNYQLNIKNVYFYSRDVPNPYLTSVAGQYTLNRGTGSGTTGNYTYPYTLQLKNNTYYDFYDWEVIIPFDTSTMTLSNTVNFNYVIKNGNLYMYGSKLRSGSTLNTSFKITYSSTTIPTLTVTSFLGKALIL